MTVKCTAMAAALTAALLPACSGGETPVEPLPRPIAWAEVMSVAPATVRRLPAVLQAADRAMLAFELPGRIEAVHVSIGDRVEPGRVLAELDDRTYRLTLAQRDAELAQARTTLIETRAEYARDADLIRDGAVSQSAFDASKARFETAESQVSLLEAAVGIARENLADTRLTAPYAGEITQRMAEPAQQAAVGAPILHIQGRQGFEAVLTVPEDWITRLKLGTRHTVSFPSRPDLAVTGTVTEIGADAHERNAYPVTLILEASAGELRSGMSAEVKLTASTAGEDTTAAAVRIPLTAFHSDRGDSTVAFVYDGVTATVEQRTIVLGEILDGGIVVLDGLVPGERIATKGLSFLSDGQRVALLGEGPLRYLP